MATRSTPWASAGGTRSATTAALPGSRCCCAPANRSIWDASATPVLELPVSGTPWPLRVDLGIGVHAISHTHINAARRLSTSFQFGEFIGATLDLGRVGIGLRVQHVSNGGIKHPNDGMTYTLLTISRGF